MTVSEYERRFRELSDFFPNLVDDEVRKKRRFLDGLSEPIALSRGGNRAGRVGPKLVRFFRAKILIAQPALKTKPVGSNSLFKVKKNSDGPGRAKFGPVFFGPII